MHQITKNRPTVIPERMLARIAKTYKADVQVLELASQSQNSAELAAPPGRAYSPLRSQAGVDDHGQDKPMIAAVLLGCILIFYSVYQ